MIGNKPDLFKDRKFLSASAYIDIEQYLYSKGYFTSDIANTTTRPALSPVVDVKESYDRMITDLKIAIELLPVTPLYTTRPSSVAAKALLAKIYLSMEDYTNAGNYADETLQKFNVLLDFNSNNVSTALTYRFPTFKTIHPEIIFYAEASLYVTLTAYSSGTGYTSADLYLSYNANDLRKTVFYQDYGIMAQQAGATAGHSRIYI